MNLLSNAELEAIEKNPDVFVEGCDLRAVYKACSPYCYVENILLATAYVCEYPLTLRCYKTGAYDDYRVLLTCKTPYGEYCIYKGHPYKYLCKLKRENQWDLKTFAIETLIDRFPCNSASGLRKVLGEAAFSENRVRCLGG